MAPAGANPTSTAGLTIQSDDGRNATPIASHKKQPFISYCTRFYDRAKNALPFYKLALHPAGMTRARTRAVVDRVSQCASSREIDPALIKFVEALAIADARRDHLFDSVRLRKNHLDAASEKCISSGVRDEIRRDLCSVLDRASKRKID